jgi:hypothetical protein
MDAAGTARKAPDVPSSVPPTTVARMINRKLNRLQSCYHRTTIPAGLVPAAKGDPGTGVSAPLVVSIL